MNRIFTAVKQNTSASGMGFAGATGLVASGLTDIASSLGPFLPWFCVIAAIATLILAFLIRQHVRAASGQATGSTRLRAYCQSFVVLLGSLFGSGVLLISGLFTENTSGSHLLSILHEIRSGVERVEEQVGEIGEGVQGLGEAVIIRDISGRSGTGMIGDNAIFQVSLANEALMDGAKCRLTLGKEWQQRVSVVDDSCDSFTVRLPSAPLLDASGSSMGDVIPIPFELEVLNSGNEVIASYAQSYPFHNNYRTIRIVLDPPGNRFKINEQRQIKVDVGEADLPDTVECEWTVFEPVSISTSSDNGCAGVLSTEVDPDSYVFKRLLDEGEIRDQIYVQLNTAADFVMLGNATLKFAVRP
jgi:hypothetical protein